MRTGRLLLAAAAAAVLVSLGALAQAPPAPGGHAETPAPMSVGRLFAEPDGASLYGRVCAGCHMPDGRGAVGAGAYPALAGNEKLEAAGYPLTVVMLGLRGMPALGRRMSDEQVAAVVNYVRTNFGNRFTDDPATPADVAALRR